MASGLHGENGLDPETCTHLFQIYVLPIMVYGLEVVLPKPALVDKLNRTYKKIIKEILSLPVTAADPAVYILSGALPIEGIIHKRTLILFGSICRLDESSVEKQLARRQLAVKCSNSNSWYIEVRKILVKYDLPSCWDLLDHPVKKDRWRRTVNRKVNAYWSEHIRQAAELYSSLKYLAAHKYWPGRKHPLIQQVTGARDIPRVSTRLKLVTGTYVTQSSRAAFNQTPVDSTCMLCQQEPETIEHVLAECSALEQARQPVMEAFKAECAKFMSSDEVNENLVQLILDPSRLLAPNQNSNQGSWYDLNKQSKRLCQTMHLERYRRLALIPTRKERKRNGKDRSQHTQT